MATSGSLNSVIITAGDGNAYKSRYLTFKWNKKSTSIGETTISWEIWGYGGNTAYSTFSISLDGQIIASVNNEVVSYKSSTPLWSGEKTYTHDNNGNATVNVNITVSKIWNTITPNSKTESWDLDKNYPYTSCGAPASTSITISPAIQKPGGEITISWNAGSEGTANAITGYKVQYKIGSEDWSSAYSTTTTSKEITLPINATRGAMITARVMSVGTVSGYDSSYSDAGGSGRINNLPGTPTVSVNKTKVPSSGATVNFTLTAGGVGAGDTGQSASLYYTTSPTGTKTACAANFSSMVRTTTTYYFWTYDGLEYSSSYASQEITVNTKPTVTLSIRGTQADNEEAIFTNGSDDQSNDNTYTFGFTYNNQDYTLSSNQTETTYSIGDMRKRLSDKLGGLIDKTTYSYNFWVYRNDGVENSDKTTTNKYSLSIPNFTLKNDNDYTEPFSKKITVTLSGEQTGAYDTIGFTGATTNGLSLDTTNLAWGTKIDKLLVNKSFYIVPQTTLHKVYEIEIVPSGGKISPFSLSTFKTYTTQQLGISLVGRTGAEYGLKNAPNLTLKYGKETLQISPHDSTSSDTYIYYVEGKEIFKGINTGASTIDLTLELKNEFNDSFERTFTLDLDHTEPAIPYTNINLYPGIDSTSKSKYPALNQWEYLKEGMPIYTDFSVLAFDEPTFIFEIYNQNNSGIWKAIPSFKGTMATTTLTDFSGVYFNTPPSCYSVTDKQLIEAINEITQDHNVQFRMRIQTTGQEVIYNFFNGTSLSMRAHYGGRAYFTKVNFADSNLETEWVVEDYGYSSNGSTTQLGLGIQEYTADIRKTTYPTSQKYVWNNFTGFENNTHTYEFLHITPILYSTLSVSTIDGNYKNQFTTTKETDYDNFIYTVVYNIAPTVSYRKNCLGINTLNPLDKTEGVLVINSYQNQNKIYLVSDTNQAFLSLQNGGMSGFIIDCGSWDGTSGGDIPGGGSGDIPTDLAQIAYTGEFADLEQKRTDIVIITAGSAEEI